MENISIKFCNTYCYFQRLFDTPATPKTIIQKSSGKISINHIMTSERDDNDTSFVFPKIIDGSTPVPFIERPRAIPLHNRILDNAINCGANVNPFTPNSKLSEINNKMIVINFSSK